MISLEVSTKSTPSTMITSENSDEEQTLSFAQLLKGIDIKEDENTDNPLILLSLDKSNTQKDQKKVLNFKELLIQENTEDVNDSTHNLLNFESSIKTLPIKEIKKSIIEAKNYLKDVILQSEGYKKAQIKTLPTTLKGLQKLAKSFDIDISKITLQEVKLSTKTAPPLPSSKVFIVQNKPKDVKEIKTKKIEGLESILKRHNSDKKIELSKEIKTESKELVSDSKNKPRHINVALNHSPNIEKTPKNQTKVFVQNEQKIEDVSLKEDKIIQDIKQSISTKAQEKISLSEVVRDKVISREKQITKTSKKKEDLSTLLHVDKATKTNPNLGVDFSVASAKVIAPTASTQNTQTLEKLLFSSDTHEDKESFTLSSKHENLGVNKSDSFELKIQEAKQMMKYLSHDVKTAIEDYKSPFTKIKVQLNPQKLGEIDLTVVQRGKNLHVNISSNNVAVNTLAMNINELKVQLSNNGINNATFNFNSSANDQAQSNANQEHQRQNKQEAQKEYNYFDTEEQNEEVLSSLEIIVPSYA